ncbi:MAG: hypothetical protein ACJ8AW_03640 [Rhodopila sp.]
MTTARAGAERPLQVMRKDRQIAVDHPAQWSLEAFDDAGHGVTPLVHLPLRCPAYGKRGHRSTVMSRSYGV